MKKWKFITFISIFLMLTIPINNNSLQTKFLPFLNLLNFDKHALTISPNGYALNWTNNGNIICNASRYQQFQTICSDGTGGAIIAWHDDRSNAPNPFDIYAQRINKDGKVNWTNNGVAITSGLFNEQYPKICCDGSGGAIIAWEDGRGGSSAEDVYAQRINSSGDRKWTTNGIVICNAINEQGVIDIISDGSGGAIIVWEDARYTSAMDIFAQRVDSNGNILWAANGTAVCNITNDQYNPKLCSDMAGGAIITWQDIRSGSKVEVYAQRVNSTGYTQWTDNGIVLANNSGDKKNPTITSDGTGGAIIAWQDERFGSPEIYAQRINSNGVTQWTDNGTRLSNLPTLLDVEPKICTDGQNGAIVTWENGDIYAQKVNSSGVVQWTAAGKPVCTATGTQSQVQIASDEQNGTIITWRDQRSSSEIYAQIINSTGQEQLEANGRDICSEFSYKPQVISDQAGGAIITWTDYRGSDTDIYAQRILLNNPPTSNHPEDITTDVYGVETINWVLYDDSGTGYYRLRVTDMDNISYFITNWITWFNGTNIIVQINRTVPGTYSYEIIYNDSYGIFGIPDYVSVTVNDLVPSSNHPADFSTVISGSETINWTLYDDFGGGFYQVWIDECGYKYVWKPFAPWTDSTPLYINLNRTAIGTYNYSIEYNDSNGQWGNIDWVIVTIGGNNGIKQLLDPGKNQVYQYDNNGFLWINLTIYVQDITNITITTNTTKPTSFGNVSGFIFYEIVLDNSSVLDNLTIRFYYNESFLNGVSEQGLGLFYYDAVEGWKSVNFIKFNYDENYIEVTLTHLTKFVLAPRQENAPFILFPPSGGGLTLILFIVIGSVAALAIVIYGIRRRKGGVEVTESGKRTVESPKEGLQIKRAYDYVGGNIRYKVVVENASDRVIKDISVELNIKEQQYEADSSFKKIKILEPGESIGSDFILTPLTCGKSRIHGNVSYKTEKNELVSMEIAPSVVQIKCPLVQPKEVSLSDLIQLMQKLQKSHTEINYLGLMKQKAYQIAKEQISALDVSEVEEQENEFHILYSGEAKVGGDLIIIDLNMTDENIMIDVYLKDIKQATGFLAYIKNLISLAIQYSSKISTTMDVITNKVYNAFEFATRLSELYNLCANKESLDTILILIKELNIKLSKYFPDLKITEIFTALFNNWIKELGEIKDEEVWDRTYLNLQYDILNWMDGIVTISETNSKIYFDSPSADSTTIKNIKAGNEQLKEQINLMNKHYSRNILFALMLVNKTSGLSMYNHNFTDKSLDSDLIGGFLTAIQSFGSELSNAKETGMQKLSYQHFEIQLQEGKHTVAALITSGIPNPITIEKQKDILAQFEEKYATDLENFVGDVGKFEKVKELIKNIFLKS
ncbi:MAG: hypothetical protein ACTSRG_20940 [Candidatus Helarchaeota archaeon]